MHAGGGGGGFRAGAGGQGEGAGEGDGGPTAGPRVAAPPPGGPRERAEGRGGGEREGGGEMGPPKGERGFFVFFFKKPFNLFIFLVIIWKIFTKFIYTF